MNRLGWILVLTSLGWAGCSGGFRGEPWLIDGEVDGGVRLRPIHVASPGPTTEPVLEPGSPIASNGSGDFQWVEEPRIVHFGEPNLVGADDPERAEKLGLGYAVRFSDAPAGARNLLIMLEGGNGCLNEAICDRTFHPRGVGSIEAQELKRRGLLDPTGIPRDELPLAVLRAQSIGDVFAADIFADAPENPFAGWSYAFLPYLSGDNWMGDNDHDVVFYNHREDTVQDTDASGATVDVPRPRNGDGSVDVPASKLGKRYRFRGRPNVRAILSRLVPSFPNVERVVIAGYSAGGLGAELNFERITLAFRAQNPNVRTALLADSGFWIRDQVEPATTSAEITGMASCAQKRMRDLFRYDRGLPSGCTACFSSRGTFAEALVTHLTKTYPTTQWAQVMSPGDETLQAVLATGKVAQDADGVSVACGRIDYAPSLFDVGFYRVPLGTMNKQMVAFDRWLAGTLGATETSVMQVTPISDHPQGKGAENHVWLLWPGLVLDTTKSRGCSPPDESCKSEVSLLEYLTSFVDAI